MSAITTAVIDLVYEKLLTVSTTDADGNTVERTRTPTVIRAAGLRDDLPFTSFRHGGFRATPQHGMGGLSIRAIARLILVCFAARCGTAALVRRVSTL
jgi:hypothetical protein